MTGRTDHAACTIRATFQPVMGTHLELQITASDEHEARAAEQTALAEATRLERAFTVFDPDSDLCRWRSGADAAPSGDLLDLLALAASWQQRSAGAFNPLAGELTGRWLQAEAEGIAPSAAELADLAASIAEPRFTVGDGVATQLGDCRALDLNAIAKGHVVDLVSARVRTEHDVHRVLVNAGGDLVHRGQGSVRVDVEAPARPFDNAPPQTQVEISDEAVATSGRARRWFEIDGRRHTRVLDPRTGRPVEHTASATVIAPSAAADETLELLARLEADGLAVAALVIGRDGAEHPAGAWSRHEVSLDRD